MRIAEGPFDGPGDEVREGENREWTLRKASKKLEKQRVLNLQHHENHEKSYGFGHVLPLKEQVFGWFWGIVSSFGFSIGLSLGLPPKLPGLVKGNF